MTVIEGPARESATALAAPELIAAAGAGRYVNGSFAARLCKSCHNSFISSERELLTGGSRLYGSDDEERSRRAREKCE
jgi:hypothetical protein